MYRENVQDTIKILDEENLTNKSLLSSIDGTAITKIGKIRLKSTNT